MKIALVITDTGGKNLVFVSNALETLSLDEAVSLASEEKINGAHVVRGASGAYIRTNPSVPKTEEFEHLSISGRELLSWAQGAHAVSTPALSAYLRLYIASLEEGQPFIAPVGKTKVLTVAVREKFEPNRSVIISAANHFNLDASLVGAIVIDEIARLHPFEEFIDLLGVKILGRNVSVGIAQVKLETANDLIKKGMYNPNSLDKKLPFTGTLSNKDREHLYTYLVQPKHSVFFAAAFIRYVIDFWLPHTDLSERPEIIGTLYHIGYGKPKPNPESNGRGEQIAEEFYPLAKRWLRGA